MKTFNTKLILSAIGIALLATPAFAQKPHHLAAHQAVQHETLGSETARHPVENQTVVPSSGLYGGSYGE